MNYNLYVDDQLKHVESKEESSAFTEKTNESALIYRNQFPSLELKSKNSIESNPV